MIDKKYKSVFFIGSGVNIRRLRLGQDKDKLKNYRKQRQVAVYLLFLNFLLEVGESESI